MGDEVVEGSRTLPHRGVNELDLYKYKLKHSLDELNAKMIQLCEEAHVATSRMSIDFEDESFVFTGSSTRIGIEIVDYNFDDPTFRLVEQSGCFSNGSHITGRESLVACGPGIPQPKYLTDKGG